MSHWRPVLSRCSIARLQVALLFVVALLALAAFMAWPHAVRAQQAAPDLVAEISITPANPGVNEQVTVSFVVRNIGDAGTGRSFTAYLYVDPPDRPPGPTTLGRPFGFPPLAAGQTSAAAARTYTFPDSGCHHRIYVWVDRDNDVVERREDNNLAAYQLCVGVSCEVDGFEGTTPPWDNTSAAAPWIYPGDQQSHTFCHAQNKQLPDDDWVKFTAFAGMTYTLQAEAAGAHADPKLILCTAECQTPLAGPGRTLFWQAPGSSVYYARVVNGDVGSPNPGPLTAYTLTLAAEAGLSDDYEPDDTCATAHDLPADGTRQQHRLVRPGDADWVRFDVQAGQSFILVADNTGPGVHPLITLYDSCAAAQDPAGALAGGQGQVQGGSDGGQTYYARVVNRESHVFGPNATYDLHLLLANCTADPHEKDDEVSRAVTVTVGHTTPLLNTCPAGDVDWMRFRAEQGHSYLMETLDLGAGADTVLTLFDRDGSTLLAENDDFGYGKGSRLSWTAPHDGIYYLRVRHFEPGAAGADTTYRLALRQGLCQPDAWDAGENSDNSPQDAPLADLATLDQIHNFCARPDSLALADQDWVRFQAQNGGVYTFTAQAQAGQSDPVLEIFAADGHTLLAGNDDAGPGPSAALVFTATVGGPYYLRVRPFNNRVLGAETDYRLSARAALPPAPTPTPSPTPAPTPSPTPTPLPADVETLILVNRERLQALYGHEATQSLMNKLQQLADHERVRGAVIPVELDPAVAAAYAAWLADPGNSDKANAVAAAIRSRILTFFEAGPAIRNVVIVGDDRVIPFRRVSEGTVTKKESSYAEHVSNDIVLESAIASNKILTDDYYVDREPSHWRGNPLYLPDYGIGRLIETPAEIEGQIDQFLAEPVLDAQRALVTGYDFVQDSAAMVATMFEADGLTLARLISDAGSSWGGQQLRALHLNAPQRFDMQAINGHSTHISTGTPDENDIYATEILTATGDLAGAIVYAVGCHSGLNDPGLVDLAQAFASRGVTYIGNTGYGWGGSGIVYSEALMRNFTRELLRDSSTEVGRALKAAKHRYRNSTFAFGPYDAKILMQATLYGLPMVEVQSGSTLSGDDGFPSADSSFSPPAFGGELNEGRLSFNLAGTFGDNEETGQGHFPDLDGHVIFSAGAPIQPQFYADVSAPQAGTLRGTLFLGGVYTDVAGYDPVIARPHNEYITDLSEPGFSAAGWWPPTAMALQNSDTVSDTADTVILSLGQYHAQEGTMRLYSQMSLSGLYSNSDDTTPPAIGRIGAVYDPELGMGRIKVEATDPSGIARVVVAMTQGDGVWQSQELAYDPAAQKARGVFTGTMGTTFFVQVADGAGNVAVDNNKGRNYILQGPLPFAPGSNAVSLYLPLLVRE